MSLEDDIRIIFGVSLFEELSSEQLRLLAFGAESKSLAEGTDLYRDGDSADCGYIVVSGAIDLFRDSQNGRRVLKRIEPGMILGELALITETTRLTGAVAAEDTKLLRINRSLFKRMLEEYPESAAYLHAKLSKQLRALLRSIGELDVHFNDS